VCVDKPALLQRWWLQHSTRCQLHGSRGRLYGAGLQVRLGVSAPQWPQDTFGKEEWGSCDRWMWEYLSTPAFKHSVAVGLEVCGAGHCQQPYVQQSGGCYRETCSSSWGRGLAVFVPKEMGGSRHVVRKGTISVCFLGYTVSLPCQVALEVGAGLMQASTRATTKLAHP
jgi:hypothetical protein